MDTSFCIEVLKHYGPPDIFNSDQGSQFTRSELTQKLTDHGVRISIDGKGRWVDNVCDGNIEPMKYLNGREVMA